MSTSKQGVYAYSLPHPSGEGWMVMARFVLTDAEGNDFPFAPMGSPEDRFIPVALRSPKQFDNEGAIQAIRKFEAEMRTNEVAG